VTLPTFLHSWAPLLAIALPALNWLYRHADRARAIQSRRFAFVGAAIAHRGRGILTCAVALTIVAIAQPVCSKRQHAPPNAAPDVVFLLDVSRSMLTRDHGESRIQQARAAIGEMMTHAANESGNQRFGLVVFAGNASVECPLTNDYAFLREQLKAASRDSVTLGGTRMGDAIRFAARISFDDASRNARELVLIGDGGDDNSAPDTAAGELAKRGIRLAVVGVGDETDPGFVPNSEKDPTPILFRGKPVAPKLERAALERICKASQQCIYTALPDAAIDRILAPPPGSQNGQSRAGGASMAASCLALAAAGLLAWERRLQ